MNTFSQTTQSIALTIDSAVETTLMIADKLKPYAVAAGTIAKVAYTKATSQESIEAYKYFLYRLYQGVVILATIAGVLAKEAVRRVREARQSKLMVHPVKSAEVVEEMRDILQRIRDRQINSEEAK